jgi:hypothetical protein
MFAAVEAACLLAVPAPYDVPSFTRVKVHRDFHVEAKACERETPVLPAAAGSPTGRFARDPAEYAMRGGTQLTLIPGGASPELEIDEIGPLCPLCPLRAMLDAPTWPSR